MAGDMDGMTREERQAFRSYVVPKPVCINKGEGHDAAVLENLQRGLEENETFVVRGAGRLEASKGMEKSLERAKKFNIAIMDIPLIPDGSNMGSELMRYIVSDRTRRSRSICGRRLAVRWRKKECGRGPSRRSGRRRSRSFGRSG